MLIDFTWQQKTPMSESQNQIYRGFTCIYILFLMPENCQKNHNNAMIDIIYEKRIATQISLWLSRKKKSYKRIKFFLYLTGHLSSSHDPKLAIPVSL
jgi:hypothetical protein